MKRPVTPSSVIGSQSGGTVNVSVTVVAGADSNVSAPAPVNVGERSRHALPSQYSQATAGAIITGCLAPSATAADSGVKVSKLFTSAVRLLTCAATTLNAVAKASLIESKIPPAFPPAPTK